MLNSSELKPKRQNHFTSPTENPVDAPTVEIRIAANAGACFGVVRAIKLGENAAGRQEPVYAFGSLIHNPKVVAELEARGVVTVESSDAVTEGTVILRSHGVRKEIEKTFRNRGVSVVDATCPLVKKPQRIAASLAAKSYFLVLVGDDNHPEVKGVLSYFAKEEYLVTYAAGDIAKIPATVQKVGVLAQTTIEAQTFNAVVEACQARFSDVLIYNTICDATSIRQSEAEVLARAADVMIVVGGRNSSNTNKLVKICKQHQSESHLIEEISELDPQWFEGKYKIGVTGGASTPQDFVDAVGEAIAGLVRSMR